MSDLQELRLGTRGSQLALWQANTVAARIAAAGGPPCRLVTVKTSGDQLQNAPLSEIGGKRLFVKEIEDALLNGEVDIAVHSSKDMPAVLPEGLMIAGVLPREDPRDAVVLPSSVDSHDADPPPFSLERVTARLRNSRSIGTGSVRRIAQLIQLFPGARFAPIRGNLDTRLRKLDEGGYDALVLAAAGLNRLGFSSRISLALPIEACIPAPGQGIVAIEARETDPAVHDVVSRISDQRAAAWLRAERAVVEALGGGCQTPIGAVAVQSGAAELDQMELIAAVASLDGSRIIRASGRGSGREARSLGARIAAQLISQGAGEILADAARSGNSN